jgi:hypothetical protein
MNTLPHVVKHRQREDSSIFTAGRAFPPAKNRQSIRQRLFRVDVGLPPVPENHNNQQDKKNHKNKITYKARIT